MSEEIQGYKELSDAKHTDKINKLIDKLVNDLQKNTRQILFDQLIRVKTESSQLLNASQSVDCQDSTVQTTLCEEDSMPSTTTIKTDTTDSAPPTKRLRKSSS